MNNIEEEERVMSRGSEWRIWDLHVHTPESYENSFTIPSDEKESYPNIWDYYVDQLEKIKNVTVLGITDYFTIEGYKKVLEYKNLGRLNNFDLIIPNIEFRLPLLTEKGKKLEIHILFNNEVSIRDIEDNFLFELHFQDGKNETRTINVENIKKLGQTLKQEDKTLIGSDFKIGGESISIDMDELLRLLSRTKRSIFKNNYLIVLPKNTWDKIPWNAQGKLTKRNILYNSDAFFGSNQKGRDWALGKRDIEPQEFVNRYRTLKPSLHGSDSHCFENFLKSFLLDKS